MGGEICLLKNETKLKLRMKMWNKGYITDTKGEAVYPEPEEEMVIEPGKFISIDATELDKLWQLKQRLCQVHINHRVYIGNRADHSGTLEVSEFLMYGGIVFFTATNNDELQKRFVPRTQLIRQLELRRRAATTCTRTRFLPCLRTKKQRIKEMEEGINSILDGIVASGAADNCADKDVGVNQVTRPITTGTCEDKHKGWSATLVQMFLQKKGTTCHLPCKEPPECSPVHIGVPENQRASGVKLNASGVKLIDQIEQKRGTNSCCMLGAKKQCNKVIEEKENSIMGDGSTSTANHNGGHCDIIRGEGNPPITAGTSDVAAEEKARI